MPCAQDIDDTPIEQIEAKADPFSIAPLVSNEIAVRPEGHISPASITINNIGNPDEDRSAVQSYSFQPYVVVYDNPTAEYGTASNAPIASANATPIHGLLEAMRGSSDKATVVSRWLAANPSAKSSVTPNDVTKIFQEVTFSLEQSSVALELSRQLGKSHLQCAHVVAACNSCSFFKADVAQVMAPYVSDIENKESILSMFASYDREKVEKALNH